jgi:hypothetical protein
MTITPISRLWIGKKGLPPTKVLKLKHDTFSIIFYPKGDLDYHIDLINLPTLEEAKELPESYYKEWLNVN